MKINTRDFGVIEVEDSSVYEFPEGVYGFEDINSFAVFMKQYDEVSFVYLQSTKSETPCFLVFSPWDLMPSYAPELTKEDLAFFGTTDEKDLIFLTIASVSSSIKDLSINIKSPIVLDPNTMKGKQAILQNSDYTIRYYPFLSEEDGAPGGKEAANASNK